MVDVVVFYIAFHPNDDKPLRKKIYPVSILSIAAAAAAVVLGGGLVVVVVVVVVIVILVRLFIIRM